MVPLRFLKGQSLSLFEIADHQFILSTSCSAQDRRAPVADVPRPPEGGTQPTAGLSRLSERNIGEYRLPTSEADPDLSASAEASGVGGELAVEADAKGDPLTESGIEPGREQSGVGGGPRALCHEARSGQRDQACGDLSIPLEAAPRRRDLSILVELPRSIALVGVSPVADL